MGGTLDGGEFKGDDDAPSSRVYIRFADVLLWKAEALLKTGKLKEAIGIINLIRRRAGSSVTADGTQPPAGTLPDRNVNESNITVVTNWLIHERRVELGLSPIVFGILNAGGVLQKKC